MTHPGRVFSRARLLDEVWGEHVFVGERTVDVHIRRLRQALTPTGHDKLIETVRWNRLSLQAGFQHREPRGLSYSTVTDLARFLGLSTSFPLRRAAWYASS
jgi:two-component system phosphate regulon response regulator PhoB